MCHHMEDRIRARELVETPEEETEELEDGTETERVEEPEVRTTANADD